MEPKRINPISNAIGVNPVRLGGLHIILLFHRNAHQPNFDKNYSNTFFFIFIKLILKYGSKIFNFNLKKKITQNLKKYIFIKTFIQT